MQEWGRTRRVAAADAAVKRYDTDTLPKAVEAFEKKYAAPDVAWTGNTGGHHGALAPLHIQTYLMPLMTGK